MSTDRTVTRLTIKSSSGSRKTVVVTSGPIPKINDAITLNGQDWTVLKVKEEKLIAEFSTAGGKLKQVFP